MYDAIHQFEPLLLTSGQEDLRERARGVVSLSVQLKGHAGDATLAALRELVRSMNSYYSNRIEGQGTHPRNIERALQKDFSDQPDVARLQRIAVAHIDAERDLEGRQDISPRSSALAIAAHGALYGRLAPADRTTEDGQLIEPGNLRGVDVDVGHHVPPAHAAVPVFLARMDEVYTRPFGAEDELLAIACLHHRLAWVHPFRDGNGRAARLQTHRALFDVSGGLWSPNRGLARRQAAYYEALAGADQPRMGDLDGRGNLSTRKLRDWCDFFLAVCEDQVRFMTRMLDHAGIRERLDTLLVVLGKKERDIAENLAGPLHYVFLSGSVSRGQFKQMTGAADRTASRQIAALIKLGLLVADSRVGPLRFGFPLEHLALLFPELYPEAATKVDH
jgi:Fic family protein